MSSMIVKLPFSLAKTVIQNQCTFETEYIDHPVLEIGSSYSCLRQDVEAWLTENNINYRFYLDHGYVIEFDSLPDATTFCMRWM